MVGEEVDVARGLPVRPDGLRDVGADVDLPHVEVVADRPAREDVGEEEVGAQLVAGVSADPRIEGTLVAQPPGLSAGAVECSPPVHEQATGDVGGGVQHRRQVEHLLIPECRALVRLAGQATSADGEPVAVGGKCDAVVVDREAQRSLSSRVALDAHVGGRPERRPSSRRCGQRCPIAVAAHTATSCDGDGEWIATDIVVVGAGDGHRRRDEHGRTRLDPTRPSARGDPTSAGWWCHGLGRRRQLVDGDHRGDCDLGASLGRHAPTGDDVVVDRCRHRREVVAVQAPHVVVDAGTDGDLACLVRSHDDLLGDGVEFGEAGESSHRDQRGTARGGAAEPDVGDLAGLHGQFDVRLAFVRGVQWFAVELDGDEQSVGNGAEFAPDAVGHVVGVGQHAADEVDCPLVRTGAAVAEVPVAGEETGADPHVAVVRRGGVDDVPARCGADVVAQRSVLWRHTRSVAHTLPSALIRNGPRS